MHEFVTLYIEILEFYYALQKITLKILIPLLFFYYRVDVPCTRGRTQI